MGRTLTIVAAPPPSFMGDPTNEGIDAVLKALPPDAESYTRRRAYSVESLGDVLKEELASARGAPTLVQIIGHGRIGVLSLGETWTGRDQDSYPRLDSNPYSHNVLTEAVAPGTRVWLLGCDVGLSQGAGNPGIADGPTLVFDLCRVWNCEVSAPDQMVIPDDFKEGVYKYPERLVRASGLAVHLASRGLAPDGRRDGVGASRS